MRWSVGFEVEADRELSREEIVELADAVASSEGIATGIGSTHYGAELIVTARTRQEAVAKAESEFHAAVARAGLPEAPITRVEVSGEDGGKEDSW